MAGTEGTVATAAECQKRCRKTFGCYYFNESKDGNCYITTGAQGKKSVPFGVDTINQSGDVYCRPKKPKAEKYRETIHADDFALSKGVPPKCLNSDYDVKVNAIDDEGSHFFLTAIANDSDTLCPNVLVLVMASIEEDKIFYSVSNEAVLGDIESHLLGKATLNEIIKAEESVESIKNADYDLLTNSCIHYAGKISRALEMKETPELAIFLIQSLLKDNGLLKVAEEKLNSGGLRVLKYVSGSGANSMIEKYVQDTVFSQLNIKGEVAIGKTTTRCFAVCQMILSC